MWLEESSIFCKAFYTTDKIYACALLDHIFVLFIWAILQCSDSFRTNIKKEKMTFYEFKLRKCIKRRVEAKCTFLSR